MKSVILVVLDGFGIAPAGPGNAVTLAEPKNIKSFLTSFPNTQLKASGEAVGLPPHEVGNTEVGHINMGAGRVVYQDLPRINLSIADGSYATNRAFLQAVKHIQRTKGNLHLIGLVGEGAVHSSLEHLFALLNFARMNNLQNVFVHAITDGRDSPPKSAAQIIKRIEEKMQELKTGKIASVLGRYYAMDRDRRWERIEKAYIGLTKGEGLKTRSAEEAVNTAYNQDKTDEFIEPTLITDETNTPISLIKEGDSVIFFNFRIDRPRELTKAFVLENFEADANKSFSFDPYAIKYHKTHYPHDQIVIPAFKRGDKIKDLFFVTMTEYEKGLPVEVAYPPTPVHTSLGRIIADNAIPQLRLTESEKERFVTFYFNGLRELPFPLEDRIIIPSPKVPTYDQKPEMAVRELTDILVNKIYEQRYQFILVNFANADMVGHTGNLQATIDAVRVLDECLGKISIAALNQGDYLLITADHGNAEQKINPQTGQPSTEHTANPVPFLVIFDEFQGKIARLEVGALTDIAPTVLSLLKLQVPEEMTGHNLLQEIDRGIDLKD